MNENNEKENLNNNKTKKKTKKKFWVVVSVIIVILLLSGSAFAYYTYQQSTMVGKPAIYFYPTSDSQIEVILDINGEITKDIPEYKNGWNVFVTREGVIENQYDYLFYENTLNKLELPEEGWIVKKENLYKWFDEYLPRLGLNEKEKVQFKEYWLYKLTDGGYYEIKLLSDDFLEENMKLSVNPQPDNLIRLIFNFKNIEGPSSIKEPSVITPNRDGFTVVEWGGIY